MDAKIRIIDGWKFSTKIISGTVFWFEGESINSIIQKTCDMKKIALFTCAVMFFGLMVSAQQQPYSPSNNPTVTAITSKYTYKEVKHEELTNEKIFPTLGNYQPDANSEVTGTLRISIDPDNKGVVWIEGLPQGKIKAMLRVSPSTYKIPMQKTELGTDIAEGTLVYDRALNKLSICLNRPYDEKDPASVFSTTTTDEQATAVVAEPKKMKTKGSKTKMKEKEEVKVVKPFIVYATKEDAEMEAK